MHRAILLLTSLLIAAPAFAQQEPTVPYQIPAPTGWAKETIQLPPSFAPDMKWHGVEELRFAPHWTNADSATFFSYALLFWLPDSQKTDAKTLESELLTYYRGLAKAVSEGKKQVIDTKAFTMSVKDVPSKPSKRASGEEVTAYLGELNWIEPFTTGKPQTLHMDIHTWRAAKHEGSCVFICAAPQRPSAAVWKSLREIRDGALPADQTTGQTDQKGKLHMRIHYLEIVCRDVNAQCAALERVHGLSFGPPEADLGQARVAEAADGSLIGVRAPLAEHEQPIIRTYLEVDDIAKAIKEAEAAGGVVAYPPTKQGETGTWAIYFLGDVQFGLWQR